MKRTDPEGSVPARRLAGQRLLEPLDGSAAELVALLGAVQAQDYAGMKWAIAQRCGDATDALVEKALDEGALVRTHLLRPTWHVVAAADLRWLLALTGPRIHAGSAGRYRELGVDGMVRARAADVFVRSLEGGRHGTRAELAEALDAAGIETATPQRLVYLLMAAELDGVICSGPRRGKQFTYALVDERVPATPPRDPEEALAELARRYYATRGPATAHDFAWWSGLTVTDARRGAEAAGMRREEIAGREHWSASAAPPEPLARPRAHLLPYYDEYTVAYRDRDAISRRLPERSGSAEDRTQALIASVVAIDGEVVGHWRRSVKRDVVLVELAPGARLGRAERRAVEAEARRYGEFLGMPARVEHGGA